VALCCRTIEKKAKKKVKNILCRRKNRVQRFFVGCFIKEHQKDLAVLHLANRKIVVEKGEARY